MLTLCYSQDVDEAYEIVYLPFGKALRHLRKAAKLSQEKLGELLSTDQTTISSWEQREIPLADDDQMATLADIFGVSVPDLEAGKVTRRVYSRVVRFNTHVTPPIEEAAPANKEVDGIIREVGISLSKLGDIDMGALRSLGASVRAFVETTEKAANEERDATRRRNAAKQARQSNSEI